MKFAAYADFTFSPDFSSVKLDNALADSQPQPAPPILTLSRRVDLIEFVKYHIKLILRYAHPCVRNRKCNFFFPRSGGRDINYAALAVKLNGIPEKISHDLQDSFLVGPNRRQIFR